MPPQAKTPVELAIELEQAIRSAGSFNETDFKQYLLPAAVIGHFPTSVVGLGSLRLRRLVEKLAASCTGLWVGRLAEYFQQDSKKLKALWLLADEDRYAEFLSNIRVEADRAAARANIRALLASDYLACDTRYHSSYAHLVAKDEYVAMKQDFVRQWLRQQLPAIGDSFPDEQQINAIAATNGAVQVVARAGSGKTTTLVRRTVFLMAHCRIPPSEILLLAFNRAAALNMRQALLLALCAEAKETLAKNMATCRKGPGSYLDWQGVALQRTLETHTVSLPNVMTFHALAYGLVNPEQTLLMDNAEGSDMGLSKALQDVIDDHLHDATWSGRVRSLMLLHFRHDWDAIEQGGYDKERDELIAHRRSLPRESLAGERVKSRGEKLIADVLLEHNVTYRYERNHRWNGFNYRPDFTIFRSAGTDPDGVVIEYFGLEGDRDYDELSDKKRAYWSAKRNWDFLEYSPRDLDQGPYAFRERLVQDLKRFGLKCDRLSEDEIWSRVRLRAIDRFTRAVSNFVGRCRKTLVTPAELSARSANHPALSDAEARFIEVGRQLYEAYLDALRMSDSEDFDGVLQRAISLVEGGKSFVRRGGRVVCDLASIRFLCVDEFQDFSELFFRLVSAIRKSAADANCFCVGDDWQAINGFAGSELRFFDDFETYMGPSEKIAISTNYRSAMLVVEAGNAVMKSQGVPARVRQGVGRGAVSVAYMDTFESTLIEQQQYAGDDITPVLLRLTSRAIGEGRRVVLLSRTNNVPWYVNWSLRPERSRRDKCFSPPSAQFHAREPPGNGQRIDSP